MFSCPLCCSNIFKTKDLLLDHLKQITNNVVCPICKTDMSSIDSLIEHLKVNNCIETIIFNIDDQQQLVQQSDYHSESINNGIQKCVKNTEVLENTVEDISEVNSLYTEILKKQQIQELNIIKECGDKFVIIDNKSAVLSNSAFVSTQNDDGTISFSIEEQPVHQEAEIVAKAEDESEDAVEISEEIYSCNTCSMTFTSVLDHIKQYHNDQNVVVEEPIESTAFEHYQDISEGTQKIHVITDANIVEDSMEENETGKQDVPKQLKPKEAKTRKRFIHLDMIDKTNTNNDTKEQTTENETETPYHKVVIKTLQTGDEKKTVYSCMHCNIMVPTLSEFKLLPCNKPTGSSKYTCSVCSIGYDNPKSLCAHMKVHKEKSTFFVCPHCSEVFENTNALCTHLKEHKNDTDHVVASRKLDCEVCNTRFTTTKALKLHSRMHYPVKPRPIQLPVGATDPKDSETFICSVCGKEIPLQYRTVHHNSHQKSDGLTCDICNKKFPTREYLEMHMNVHNMYKVNTEKQENGEFPYKCLYCDRNFARPHEKVKHERIHTGEKPHVCEICGKSFRVSYCLTLHMRTHTGARPYVCPHCPKRFKAYSVFNHHILTHSDVRAYKCPFCPKSFKTSVQLAGHRNSHTKPFQCQICNRPFASLYAVRLHMDVHSRMNSLKFKCTECGASYARAFALKDHVRQAHSYEEGPIDVVEQKEDKLLWNTNIEESEEIETDLMKE